MGYTHYWKRPPTIARAAWRPLHRDVVRMIEALPARYPGPHATGEPVAIRGGADGDRPFAVDRVDGHPDDPHEAIQFNGDAERGAASATFYLPRVHTHEWDFQQPDPDGRHAQHTKTNRHPYDLAVSAALLLARHHVGDAFDYRSDGPLFEQSWPHALPVVRSVVGPQAYRALLADHLAAARERPCYGELVLGGTATTPGDVDAVVTPEERDRLIRDLAADTPDRLLAAARRFPGPVARAIDRETWRGFVEDVLWGSSFYHGSEETALGALIGAVPEAADRLLDADDLEGLEPARRDRALLALIEAAPGPARRAFGVDATDLRRWLASEEREVRERALLVAPRIAPLPLPDRSGRGEGRAR